MVIDGPMNEESETKIFFPFPLRCTKVSAQKTKKTASLWLVERKKRLVERKPIWLPQAYLTRGDLEPARGNLHVCKFLQDLTNIQIRTVMAERVGFVLSAFARRTCYISKKEGSKARTGRRERKTEGRRTMENAREKEKALDSIRPETNNSVLS